MKKFTLITLASLISAVASHGQVTTRVWDGLGGNNLWANSLNWGGNTPDTNLERAQFNGTGNLQINIATGESFTINSYLDGFAGNGNNHLIYGGGTLVIDVNSSGAAKAISNETGNNGSILRFNSKVEINNTLGGNTVVRNQNSSSNIIRFDTNSTLTLTTALETQTSAGGSIEFNGTFGNSSADLIITSNNVSFGTGHDSKGFGRDIVMNSNSKLAVNSADVGSVLNTGRKFQINGTNAEIELNGADAINNANINAGGSNSLLLDVNANQADMGIIAGIGSNLTIDLDPTVTLLAFNDSSLQDWTGGTVTIAGFQNGVIRFGTDALGLTPTQLGLIDGGAYTLDSSGFLVTVPEPSTFALLAGGLALGFIMVRRKRS